MPTVHLRVTDADTRRPTAVRLSVAGPDGTAYTPFGVAPLFPVGRNEDIGGRVRVGRDVFAFIDGGCEIALPTGVPLRVRVFKGPRYEPIDREVTLGVGQMALRFEIRRVLDTPGWVSADTRAHFLPPHAALLEAAAEDLDVVNLLATSVLRLAQDGNTYPAVPNLTAFSGQSPALAADGRQVVVNTFNTHPVLGRVGLLNSHRVVFPLAFGEPHGPDDWGVVDWCLQCHRKGGLTVWADAFRTDAGMMGGEALVALMLDEIDAIELDAAPRPQPFLPWYYRLLNAGLRPTLVGGSGKDSNRTPLGAVRTYARLPDGEPLTYAAWIAAVKAGRTFVTNGPLLSLSVNDAEPGATTDAAGPVRVVASADSATPFEKLEVIAGGRSIAAADCRLSLRESSATFRGAKGDTGPTDTPIWSAKIEIEHEFAESDWLAARCVGGKGSLFYPPQPAFAHTSPVWVRVDGRPPPRRTDAVAALVKLVDDVKTWAVERGVYADERFRAQLVRRCGNAVAALAGAP